MKRSPVCSVHLRCRCWWVSSCVPMVDSKISVPTDVRCMVEKHIRHSGWVRTVLLLIFNASPIASKRGAIQPMILSSWGAFAMMLPLSAHAIILGMPVKYAWKSLRTGWMPILNIGLASGCPYGTHSGQVSSIVLLPVINDNFLPYYFQLRKS